MEEEKNLDNVELADTMDELPMKEVTKVEIPQRAIVKRSKVENTEDVPLVSCLRNERVSIRFIPRTSGQYTNPKHIYYGGMAENAVTTLTVPINGSGQFVNVLTNSEKAFLEEIMGLDKNALSIYLRVDNFWENYTIKLYKYDNFLDLSIPEDYIKYKVLLANRDIICDSLATLQDAPKATFKFVIVTETEEVNAASKDMNTTMECYKEYGKVEDNLDILRTIVETLEGKPVSPTTKLTFLQGQINKLIQAKASLFLKVIKDPYLSTRVLIKRATEAGLIYKRGDFYYLKQDNTPLCGSNEEPTLVVACTYLNLPKNQAIKFMLEAKLK